MTEAHNKEWADSILKALRDSGAELVEGCKVYDSVGDMLYGAGGDSGELEYFVAVAGNDPDDPDNTPIRNVMVIHVSDLMHMAMKVLSTLRGEGKIEYLQSLGIPIVDMSGEDDDASPEHTLQ